MSETTPARVPRHPGIYLLPNLFTTGAMFAGFYAIVVSIGGHFTDAAIAVFVAALLDGIDGRVARLTHTQSEFGVQYDSLSDLVSFGLAPSLVMYNWSLSSLREFGPLPGKIGWAAAFIYAVCAALRLARFNTQVALRTSATSRVCPAPRRRRCACRSCGAWTTGAFPARNWTWSCRSWR